MMRALMFGLCLLSVLVSGGSAQAAKRVALVIGNGAYQNVPKLENPAGDAHAMAELLESVGFEVVEGTDVTRDGTTAMTLKFAQKAKGADVALFYYAGQSVEIGGEDYVLPIDADIKSATDIKLGAAIDLDDMLAQTVEDANIRLVFLDTSRTNPFAGIAMAKRPLAKSSDPSIVMSGEGTLMIFATGPGGEALDGPKGGHSPFTQALLENIAAPGMEIQQALTRVRVSVHGLTGGRQLPWEHSNLAGEVYLNPQTPPSSAAGGAK